jgi:phosphate transport system protein
MERHLHEEIKHLNEQLLQMAALAEEAIHKSVEALKQQNGGLAQEVIAQDSVIDEYENRIEEQAIDLLACFQPMAVDLRFITTGMKINAELERIADLAVNIAQRTLELVDKPLLKPLIDIPKLAEVAKRMVKGAIDAFVRQDKELARQVILSDPEADALRNEVQRELLDDFMSKDKATVPRAVPLLLIVRHLERICDHATNIAEDVIYMVEALIVKHHPEKLNPPPNH